MKNAAAKFECQVCEGRFCVKNGLLVKHGFKRPGDGFLHGECMGVGHAPFPSTTALVPYRAMISTLLSDRFARLNELSSRVETVLLVRASCLRPLEVKELAVGVTPAYDWDVAISNAAFSAKKRVREFVAEVARVDARIALAALSTAA
jgi:hypothetical protein